jgi:hypothetical protein
VLVEDISRRKSRRSSRSGANGSVESVAVVEFRNDPAKFGTPTQQWKTAEKAIWLLHVVKETAQVSELSTGQIVKTFNTHFRQAKTVTSSNVSRDLGKLKVASPALVGEDNTKTPPVWYLTDEGIRHVQAQIAESNSPSGV